MKELEVVAAILIHEEKVLCVQRGHSKYEYISYRFEFPGGKVEPNESHAQALKRELLEELELDVTMLDEHPYLTIDHSYPDFTIHLHAYRCRAPSLVFRLKEHISSRLLPPAELLKLDWAPADVPILEKLMKDIHFDTDTYAGE